jgi:molybdopterin converting factor small subunit
MEVTVRFTGILRRLAQNDAVQLDLKVGASLRQALVCLQETLPTGFSAEVLAPVLGGTEIPAILLLNRSSVHKAEQLEVELSEGDIIAFATPMEGG